MDRLREHWEDTNSRTGQRQNQLEDMLLECRQFEEKSSEFERWITPVEEDLDLQTTYAKPGLSLDGRLKKLQVCIRH